MSLSGKVLLCMALVESLISAGNFAFAQASQECPWSIQGTIRDHQTAEGLLGATVYVKELERGAVANEKGQYFIPDVCAGTFTLICRFAGYVTDSVHLSISRNTRKNFGLGEATTELRSITIE